MNSLINLLKISNKDYSYCDPADKNLLHTRAGRFLRELVRDVLNLDDWSVRNNKAGIACSGEITLHASDVYIQVCEDFFGPGMQIMIRGCRHPKDYSGLTNRYVKMAGRTWEEVLDDIKQTVKVARHEAQVTKEKKLATQ